MLLLYSEILGTQPKTKDKSIFITIATRKVFNLGLVSNATKLYVKEVLDMP